MFSVISTEPQFAIIKRRASTNKLLSVSATGYHNKVNLMAFTSRLLGNVRFRVGFAAGRTDEVDG